MSQQDGTIQYLTSIFEDLDREWIKELISQFPTQPIEFLTEQCVERCQQINDNKNKNKNHKQNDNHIQIDDDINDYNQSFNHHLNNNNNNNNKEEKKNNDNNDNNNRPDLPLDQLNFLYSSQIDSDDEVIMNDKITDQGPSISLLSSVPQELSLWFESFCKSISSDFHPGLLEILLHLEMIKYNTSFAFSPKPNNNNNDNTNLVQCLDFLTHILTNLESSFDDMQYRMFPKSDDKFRQQFSTVQGAETLLKYTGWKLIETDKADNGGLYVYDEENDKNYLTAIIQVLKMYTEYLKGNEIKVIPANNNSNNIADNNNINANINNNFVGHNKDQWQFNDSTDKKDNMLSIFEDDNDNKLEEKELTRQDSYVTPQKSMGSLIIEELKINSKIEMDIDNSNDAIDIPRHLNINEFLLHQRAVVYGAPKNINLNINSHQWPSDVPGYALIEEHKKNNINIYTYMWDEFPSHTYKYFAMECELNKFARIQVSVMLGNCEYNNIKSGSVLDDVQIFRMNYGNKIQVLTEMGPFEKKLMFTVKYLSRNQLAYSWKYSSKKTTYNDMYEYIRNSNNMFEVATEKYLKLYQKFDLHKMADNVNKLHNILTNKLSVSCFIDLEFPPVSNSLITKTATNFQDSQAFEGLIWKRVLDFAEYPHLFGPAIMLSDVQQGSLGNCGFAASLIAISIYPQLIKKLFLFPNNTNDNNGSFNENIISPIGLYEMKLCHNGIWRQYTIDDLIPCNYNGNPAFTSHENKNLLWVSLVEKCAAKSYGGYDRLIAFCKLNAFNDLTGCPVEQIDFNIFENDYNGDILWQHLMGWNNNKYTVMTLAATLERSKKPISDLGIKGNHAFTFLKAVQVENIRLIQIRNPWGKCNANVLDRWKGDYSRYNYKGEWTDMLKAIVRPELGNNDGTFWMKLTDFMQYFRAASLCHLLVLDETYKILRMNTKIIYDYNKENNSEDILYPKLILDLTTGFDNGKMELEWIGVQQANLRSQYAIHCEYLDCCILIGQLLYPNDNEKCQSDAPAYIQPLIITECRKSKSEFEKLFTQLIPGQKYVLIPYSTGITFHKNFKALKQHQKRNINISLYIKNKNGINIQNNNDIKLEYQKSLNIKQIKPILTHFVEVLGKKKQSGELEYIQASFGTLTFSGIRHKKFDKIMRGTFSFDLINTLPAIGFDQGFILKNNICKNEVDYNEFKNNNNNNHNYNYSNDKYDPPREWKWIYTCNELKCMETNLFVMGQYERFKKQQWRFMPEIFFSSLQKNEFQPYNNNNFGNWFGFGQ